MKASAELTVNKPIQEVWQFIISLDNSRLNISNSIIEGPKFIDGENIIFN